METSAPARPRRRRQSQRQEETPDVDFSKDNAIATAAPDRAAAAPPRDDQRSELRPETSRERAEREGREILERTAGQDTDFHDDFQLPRGIEPDGWEYQWKTRTVLGAENPGEMVALEMAGWRAVPAARHPELMPTRGHFELIERGGQILMECPRIVTDAQRIREKRKAMERLEINRQRLGAPAAGTTFQRNDGARLGADPKISHT